VPEELQPDETLRQELELDDGDEVHTVTLTSGAREEADPDSVTLPPGAWAEFVSGDWRIHEVRFEVDSMGADQRSFLESTDQVASPPLVDRDDRFVLSFAEAPAGRYPFVVEGNGASTRGVVVVEPRP
jgi:plastocyanin